MRKAGGDEAVRSGVGTWELERRWGGDFVAFIEILVDLELYRCN